MVSKIMLVIRPLIMASDRMITGLMLIFENRKNATVTKSPIEQPIKHA